MRVQIINQATSPDVAAALPAIVEACRQGLAVAALAHGRREPIVAYGAGSVTPLDGLDVLYVRDRGATGGFLQGSHIFEGGRAVGQAFDGFAPAGQLLRDPNRRGASLAAIISHELLEMMVDRAARRYVRAPLLGGDGTLYDWVAEEIADPVQESTRNIAVEGGLVDFSNWVTPAWFTPGAAGPYDSLGLLEAPLTLAPGGYAVAVTAAGRQRDVYVTAMIEHGQPMAEWRAQMKKANELGRTNQRMA